MLRSELVNLSNACKGVLNSQSWSDADRKSIIGVITAIEGARAVTDIEAQNKKEG